MAKSEWVTDFVKSKSGDRKKHYEGFFTHCVACDMMLNDHYMETGLCGDCQRDVDRCSNPYYDYEDRVYMDNLWKNPQGSIEESLGEGIDQGMENL